MDGIVLGRHLGPVQRILTGSKVLGNMPQGLDRPPVLPEPGKRFRVVRAKLEHAVWHRDERMQIEWARLAHSHTSDSTFVATANGVPQLPGQHPRSGYAQRPQLRVGWCHQQVKDILLQAVEVDLPGDDSRACGGAPEGSELIGRPHDNEAMVQPIGMCQPHRCGLTSGFGARGRMRRTEAFTRCWCGYLHICSARALKDWMEASDSRFGPVFRKVDRWGNVEHRRLGTDAIRRILARRVRRRVRRGAAL